MTKKHLTLDERMNIHYGLMNNYSFKKIALLVDKNCTTISREVRSHIYIEKKGVYGRGFNDCKRRKNCKECYEDCKEARCKKEFCSYCKNFCMTSRCPSYVKEVCPKLKRSPYVCNGCSKKMQCQLEKHFYSAELAYKQYRDQLTSARNGIAITEEEVLILNECLQEGFKKGQSIYHIIQTVGEEVIGFSPKTIYKYIQEGVFKGIGNIDLPRKVRYRPRVKKEDRIVKKDKNCREGRTYEDFKAFKEGHPDVPVVEMDSVLGKKGINEKVLLTIHFTNCKLMLAFIRDRNTAASVVETFDSFKEKLTTEEFSKLFPVLLTDNGSEFSDPLPIELNKATGEIATRIFYCDARQSQQKGACENNHEFIRRISPKGRSMNPFTQEDIDLMMSHINSYKREELGGKSPYEVFSFLYGTNILDKLNIRGIDPKEVTLKPELLKK